jgi:EAL domain-containing protein (putative c-di-GMP-specific phosphodiesterase class I)/PleD family two-component response regulator
MTEHDGSQLAEAEAALPRRWPARAHLIARRLHRFHAEGWDINGLFLVQAEAAELGAGCAAADEPAAGPLQRIAALAGGLVQREELPGLDTGDQLLALAEALAAATPEPAPEPEVLEVEFEAVELVVEEAVLVAAAPEPEPEPEPEPTVDLWGDDASLFAPAPSPTAVTADGRSSIARTTPPAPAMTATPASASASASTFASAASAPASPPARAPAAAARATPPVAPAPAPASKPDAAPRAGAEPALPRGFRLYHLTDYGSLSLELDQRFEGMGLEVELLEQVEELNELLGAVPADLVLIDGMFAPELEDIGTAMRTARAKAPKLRLAAVVDNDDMAIRLAARRAGVDALIVAPKSAGEVLSRLQQLAGPAREENFRILIVEDDRSQALFAEGILRNAGMDSLVVIDALDVMPALRNFRPDLILMDLNMPGANGIELTALIREQEAFAHTPIVFLSGEASEDLQFDAIDAGGDDFLSKPIRPRHLISAVQTRVRRYRQQESRKAKRPDKDAATGLVYRKTLLEQLDESLVSGQDRGGLVFLEVESLALLRERIGLTALEILLGDVSRLLTQHTGDLPTTRFGDGSWLVLDRQREELALDSLATELRALLMGHAFQALGHPLRLRIAAGVAAFKHPFADSGAMINAVEKVAREARSQDRGVRRYEPPRSTEAVKEAALLEMVRTALDQDTLVLLYQPVVAVAGGDVSQYQALLRLRDASGKLRPAAEIIPMAERTSLIVEIDRWVMLQALRLVRERHAEGEQLRLFVTQSPLTLAAPGQAAWLKHELAAGDIPGDSLVIEVRLDDAAVHAATVRQFCEAMATTRVQFCLSQFEAGADAATLSAQLPLAFVKLARKYTTGTLSPALRDELKQLIDAAHARRLSVIGHGVEDAQAAATLWMSGIDYIQGNLVQQADAGMNFDFHQAVL